MSSIEAGVDREWAPSDGPRDEWLAGQSKSAYPDHRVRLSGVTFIAMVSAARAAHRLYARVASLTAERVELIDLVSQKSFDLHRDGKTLLDFHVVWLGQARAQVAKLEAELAQLKGQP